MEFRKPDLKGPRFKTPSLNILDKNLFKKFREKYPDYSTLNYATFCKVIKKDNEKIPKLVMDNRDGVELRESLGNIFIGACEPGKPGKNKMINYGESIKLGKVVLHKNWETDNYLAKIMYTNTASKCGFENRYLWKFKGCRNFVRESSKVFKKNYMKYIQIKSGTQVSSLFRQYGQYNFRSNVKD